MPRSVDKVAYNASQAARVSWFFGQKLLAARLSRPVPLPDRLKDRPMPDRQKILADLWALLRQDWRNIEAGLYAPPDDGPTNPIAALAQAIDFFADLRAVEARRHGGRDGRK
ncbi:MAG TPA: ubiquinone biosynthesis methyltransferase UbiE, partial [Stellaceae bacterium]|nr:ubiquinone biosynthesis methyltransferase UbiE [Stellaceae bacterium]